MTEGELRSQVNESSAASLALVNVGERTSRFRILTINGKRRAFALEPVFWTLLEEAAEASDLRLSDYVGGLLAGASRANHSALLRVKAAEWADQRRKQLRERGFLAIGRRLAASHSAPAFVIDRHGSIVAHNKPLADLLREGGAVRTDPTKTSVKLRLGVTVQEMMRLLRSNPEKFLRVKFSLLYDSFERPGTLNAMLLGEEMDQSYALGIVQAAHEALPRR